MKPLVPQKYPLCGFLIICVPDGETSETRVDVLAYLRKNGLSNLGTFIVVTVRVVFHVPWSGLSWRATDPASAPPSVSRWARRPRPLCHGCASVAIALALDFLRKYLLFLSDTSSSAGTRKSNRCVYRGFGKCFPFSWCHATLHRSHSTMCFTVIFRPASS